MPVKNTWERTENCSCFAAAIYCLLFTFFRLSPFPEISPAPSSPAGWLCTLLANRANLSSKEFLLLAAWEGVLFALPKCSQGLMLRCYVQTISTVMNHVLPPLCFYFCSRCFFSFWANTLEFPCLLLTQCMSGTRHRLSYSYRPTTDMISKSISHSRSCRPFVLPTTKGKLIQAQPEIFLPDNIKKTKYFTEKASCSQAKYALFLSYLLWVTQAICTTPCARKELFVHVSLLFFQVLNFKWNLSLQILILGFSFLCFPEGWTQPSLQRSLRCR